MSVVAVIPARGGSKRIPRKNIKPFLGKPMIAYPIAVLHQTELFDRVIVSTDDEEIAEIALEQGAEVPFVRPNELADDHTGTGEVVNHTIEWLLDHGERPDYVCCVYATTPFLSAHYLEEGWKRLSNDRDKQFAFSVTSFPYPIQRSLKLTPHGGVEPFFPEYIPYRSQDLEPAYHDAGQFYWGRAEAFLEGTPVFSDAAIPVVLPRHYVQDIDDEEDWLRAELMYRAFHHGGMEG